MTQLTPPAGYAELLKRDQWVNAESTKIPYTPSLSGRKVPAKAGEPATFRSFNVARGAQAAGRFPHVGFEFTEEDDLFLIDLDKQRDPRTGELTTLARAALVIADTLAEPSVSGTGLHIIGRARIPRALLGEGRLGRKVGPCEIYFGAHYGIMTFRPLPGHDTIRDVDDETMRLLFRLLLPDEPKVTRPAPPPAAPTRLDDAALLDKAFAAKGGDDLRRQHDGTYLQEDKSRCDYAYFGRLYFWCGGDPIQLRRLAEASARRRDKWFTRRGDTDWLGYSIARICREGGEVYDPVNLDNIRVNLDNNVQKVAHACSRCGELAAEAARLTARLAFSDAEGERVTLRNAELETENAALEAAIRHPVQATGIGTLDQVEAAQRAYRQGEVVTLGGEDFARVPSATAAKRRSAKTLTTGLKALIGLTAGDPLPREPVAFGRDRAFAVFARSERIETPTFKGDVDIPYIFIPEALRGQRGKAVLGILPTCAGPKRHGGRRTIPVPPEVAAQPDPVRRKREHVTRWYAALTDQPLATQTEHLGTDYWTAQGEALGFDQITQQRVALGHEPPRAPAYRPTQPPLRMHRAEPRQVAEVPHSLDEPPQLADSLTTGKARQDAEVCAPPTVAPGRCPDCGAKATIGGCCAEHFNGHVERHRATWAYAQAGD